MSLAKDFPLGASLLAAAVALPMGPSAHAETPPERGSISFKYLDYFDSQPGADRIQVKAPSLMVTTPVGEDWSLSGTYITDSISGASPAYHTSGLTRLRDFRRAGSLAVTRYFSNGLLTVGATGSTEHDYLSRALYVQAGLSSADKNTTWTLGWAGTRDVINPTNAIVENERKRTDELLLGITQVMTRNDLVQLNLGYSRGAGYFSDPYKVLDNRPRERNQTKMLVRWNHHIDATEAVTRLSYRYYADTYGIRAHTVGFEYMHPLGRGWAVTPLLRYYTQSAARFYVDVDPESGPFPTNPPDGALYSSLDQRLAGFGAVTVGVKVAKQLNADWLVDVKFEQYGQRSFWKLAGGGSAGLAPFDARSIQLGITRLF